MCFAKSTIDPRMTDFLQLSFYHALGFQPNPNNAVQSLSPPEILPTQCNIKLLPIYFKTFNINKKIKKTQLPRQRRITKFLDS